MLKGIDCAAKISAAAALEIKAEGYDFVCRYLVPNSGSLAWKALTAQEAQGISDAGLQLLCVYESTASRCRGGAAAGTADGRAAVQLAQAYGIPETAIIYFAVDYDAQAGDYALIEAYLRAARAQTDNYEVGVYGSFGVVEAMAQRRACQGFWQCYAWSYRKVSNCRNVYQYKNGQTVAGISVDLDEAVSDVGLWSYNAAANVAQTNKSEDDYMMRFSKLENIPNDYGFRDIIDKLMTAEIISGDGSDKAGNNDVIDLSLDQVRTIIFNYRGGAYDRKLIAQGMTPAVQV